MRDRTFQDDPDWVLQVNGHTDIQQYRHTRRFPRNNWELSAARALAVAMRLQSRGMEGKRLAAAGYSEHRPIDEGRSEEAYRVNRRVEFKLVEYGRQAGRNCPPLPADLEEHEEEEEG
jgi:chemotaxis protein MotB